MPCGIDNMNENKIEEMKMSKEREELENHMRYRLEISKLGFKLTIEILENLPIPNVDLLKSIENNIGTLNTSIDGIMNFIHFLIKEQKEHEGAE